MVLTQAMIDGNVLVITGVNVEKLSTTCSNDILYSVIGCKKKLSMNKPLKLTVSTVYMYILTYKYIVHM